MQFQLNDIVYDKFTGAYYVITKKDDHEICPFIGSLSIKHHPFNFQDFSDTMRISPNRHELSERPQVYDVVFEEGPRTKDENHQ